MTTTIQSKRRRFQLNRRLAPYLFILPNMAIFAVFIIWPAINGFNISFYDSNNGRTFTYVGLDNYAEILTDADFWEVARNTTIFVVLFVMLTTWLSIFLASLLNAQVFGRGFFRAVLFLPVLLSPIVVGLLWNWIFDRQAGLFNGVLNTLGLGSPAWLVDGSLAMGVIVFVGIWTHVGFYTLILLAGLQGIDQSVYEAARLDGAGIWKTFTEITLPLLRPTTLVIIVLSMIAGFQAYDYIYTLTGGGPLGSTTLIVQYIYENAFQSPIRYGLASAAGVLLFLVIFGVTLVNFLLGRRKGAV